MVVDGYILRFMLYFEKHSAICMKKYIKMSDQLLLSLNEKCTQEKKGIEDKDKIMLSP